LVKLTAGTAGAGWPTIAATDAALTLLQADADFGVAM
jgi:hypothetical protein